jgi:hypothetical protein
MILAGTYDGVDYQRKSWQSTPRKIMQCIHTTLMNSADNLVSFTKVAIHVMRVHKYPTTLSRLEKAQLQQHNLDAEIRQFKDQRPELKEV